MLINRVWAMPNKYTFQIKPIKELLDKYVKDGFGWADCFSGMSTLAQYTNDLNPKTPAKYHMTALDFSKMIDSNLNGVLFDPPYSARQTKECYDNIGLSLSMEDTQASFWSNIKNELSKKVKSGGYAISFGWNSNGFGKNRGFEIVEILLIPHGSNHNDTIVTVEKKINNNLEAYNNV